MKPIDKKDLPPPEQLPPPRPVQDQPQPQLEIPVPLPPDPREEESPENEKNEDGNGELVPDFNKGVPMVPGRRKKRKRRIRA